MTPEQFLKNKKVLVMGLGLLGGGLATTRWLIKHGAKVTVTDLKPPDALKNSILALETAAKKVKLVLGRHRQGDFRSHQIIVVNPAVPKESPYLKIARRAGAKLENEASLFFRFCQNPLIAVTGTRGKTTTVNWLHHILKKKFPYTALTGNSSDNPMLKTLDSLDGQSPVVVELSSWHLELLPKSHHPPHIAVITNIYTDHLNRYKNMKEYVLAKAKIFKYQTKEDLLVLNRSNQWTKFFVAQKPAGTILYFPADIGVNKNNFVQKYGEHNWVNITAAALAANLAKVSWAEIKGSIKKLPQVKFRQEIIFQSKKLTVINDTTATSPDATVAALKRFASNRKNLVLITGGTDKKLIFNDWAAIVKKYIKKENLVFLEGSATQRMIQALKKKNYFGTSGPKSFDNLSDCLTFAINRIDLMRSGVVLLFSPASASFEKFKNEFDRGIEFNRLFFEPRR